MKSKVGICLTGHRPDKLDGYNLNTNFYKILYYKLIKILELALEKYDVIECSSGLALGADTIWSYAILNARLKYPGRIKFHAHIPNWDHSKIWPSKSDRDFWSICIKNADEVHVIDPNLEFSFGASLNMRNHSMVDMSEFVIGVYDGSQTGGTSNCLRYAKKKNKKLILLDPNEIKKTVMN